MPFLEELLAALHSEDTTDARVSVLCLTVADELKRLADQPAKVAEIADTLTDAEPQIAAVITAEPAPPDDLPEPDTST